MNDELVGALTLYSIAPNAFSADHRRIIEAISTQIAHALIGAGDFASTGSAFISGRSAIH